MTLESLEKDINEMIPTLFAMAREATWNKISENHKFILSEIILLTGLLLSGHHLNRHFFH